MLVGFILSIVTVQKTGRCERNVSWKENRTREIQEGKKMTIFKPFLAYPLQNLEIILLWSPWISTNICRQKVERALYVSAVNLKEGFSTTTMQERGSGMEGFTELKGIKRQNCNQVGLGWVIWNRQRGALQGLKLKRYPAGIADNQFKWKRVSARSHGVGWGQGWESS